MNSLLKMAGVFSRFSLATYSTMEKLKNSSKKKIPIKVPFFWLSVWRKWCVEKEIQSEIQNIPPVVLNILLERFCAEVKNKDGNDYEPDSLIDT